MAWTDPVTLFKASALIYAIAIPGHLAMGFDVVYPALNKIPLVGKHVEGKRGAQSCWNAVAVALFVAACLNWQWARTGGPKSIEEEAMFWAIAGMNTFNSLRYAQVGVYTTLGPLFLAPALSVLAKRSLS